MKSVSVTALMSAFAMALATGTALAQQPAGDAGGFSGPDSTRVVTAAEVAGLADDTHVRLTGRILRSLGDEKYEFSDDSGTLVVEIDDEDWKGVAADPSTVVELTGEVDKEWKTVELDVDRVTRVQ